MQLQQAASASRSPGRSRFGTRQTMVDIDAVVTNPKGVQPVALGGEILMLGRYSGIAHHEFIHLPAVARPASIVKPTRQSSRGWMRNSQDGGWVCAAVGLYPIP